MSETIKMNHTLTSLDMRSEWDSKMVKENIWFPFIWWIENEIRVDGVRLLYNSLQCNSTLTLLNIDDRCK